MEDEQPGDIAVITNEDWHGVKSSISSIQQQCHLIRMQQFQFMQLIASQQKQQSSASSTKQTDQSDSVNPGRPICNDDASICFLFQFVVTLYL